MVMDQHAKSVRPTSLQTMRSMASSAMAVECDLVIDQFIYLFIYLFTTVFSMYVGENV